MLRGVVGMTANAPYPTAAALVSGLLFCHTVSRFLFTPQKESTLNDQINQLLANHVAGLRIAVDRLAELYPNGAVDKSTAEWLKNAKKTATRQSQMLDCAWRVLNSWRLLFVRLAMN
jgi:hypothetical protein